MPSRVYTGALVVHTFDSQESIAATPPPPNHNMATTLPFMLESTPVASPPNSSNGNHARVERTPRPAPPPPPRRPFMQHRLRASFLPPPPKEKAQYRSKTLPPPERLRPLTPPPNFARVTDNIYRSSFPGPDNLKFLSLFGFEEIFILSPDEPSDEYDFWIFKQGNIIVRQLEVAQNKTSICTTTDEVGRIVNAVQRAVGMGKTVLVHCNGGKHRTGCVVGALRLGMGWEIEEVVEEYRAFAGRKRRDGDEEFLWRVAGSGRLGRSRQ